LQLSSHYDVNSVLYVTWKCRNTVIHTITRCWQV